MKSFEDGLKQRLIGAIVLLALAVIFLPVVFERKHLEPIDTQSLIPPEPEIAPLIEPPEALPPEDVQAPEPDVMFVPDERHQASAQPEPMGLDTAAEVKSWVLQLASFREHDHAKALEKKLISDGFTAFSRESRYKNGSVVRVYIGPKLDKSELQRIKAQVDERFEVQSILLEFRPI